MCIMAGLDLLATFYAGTSISLDRKSLKKKPGAERWKYGVGKRFEHLLTKFGHLNGNDAKVIYALRNTLLHSFGIYNKRNAQRFRLTAETSAAPLIQLVGSKLYCVNLVELHRIFEQDVLSGYEGALHAAPVGSDIELAFKKMYPDFGWMLVFATANANQNQAHNQGIPNAQQLGNLNALGAGNLIQPLPGIGSTGTLFSFCKAASGM
jgi:hypothetical protein